MRCFLVYRSHTVHARCSWKRRTGHTCVLACFETTRRYAHVPSRIRKKSSWTLCGGFIWSYAIQIFIVKLACERSKVYRVNSCGELPSDFCTEYKTFGLSLLAFFSLPQIPPPVYRKYAGTIGCLFFLFLENLSTKWIMKCPHSKTFTSKRGVRYSMSES
jgi:hypothetical protein